MLRVWSFGNSHSFLVTIKTFQTLWGKSVTFVINISYDPEISLVAIYLSEIKINVFKHKPVLFYSSLVLLPITGNKLKFPQLG